MYGRHEAWIQGFTERSNLLPHVVFLEPTSPGGVLTRLVDLVGLTSSVPRRTSGGRNGPATGNPPPKQQLTPDRSSWASFQPWTPLVHAAFGEGIHLMPFSPGQGPVWLDGAVWPSDGPGWTRWRRAPGPWAPKVRIGRKRASHTDH